LGVTGALDRRRILISPGAAQADRPRAGKQPKSNLTTQTSGTTWHGADGLIMRRSGARAVGYGAGSYGSRHWSASGRGVPLAGGTRRERPSAEEDTREGRAHRPAPLIQRRLPKLFLVMRSDKGRAGMVEGIALYEEVIQC
jgi:hypothetical protein